MDNDLRKFSEKYLKMGNELVYKNLIKSPTLELIVHIYSKTNNTSVMLGDKTAKLVVHTLNFSSEYKKILSNKFKILKDDGGGIYTLSPEDLNTLSELLKNAKFKWSNREIAWTMTVQSAEQALEELKRVLK